MAKLHTREGMSSQLILRYEAIKFGEIDELLEGEKEYEEARHALRVFYQTRNFCNLSSESRKQALNSMLKLRSIVDEDERQSIAKKDPVFGLRPEI